MLVEIEWHLDSALVDRKAEFTNMPSDDSDTGLADTYRVVSRQ